MLFNVTSDCDCFHSHFLFAFSLNLIRTFFHSLQERPLHDAFGYVGFLLAEVGSSFSSSMGWVDHDPREAICPTTKPMDPQLFLKMSHPQIAQPSP